MLKPVIAYANAAQLENWRQFNKISAPKITAQLVQDAITKVPILKEGAKDIIMAILTAGSGQAPALEQHLWRPKTH